MVARVGWLILTGVFLARPLLAADWPQFRGPNAAGIADATPIPTEFGPGVAERWQTAVGAGHSSPCVVADAIFLTTYDDSRKRLEVVCLDRATGDLRWRRAVAAQDIETGHPSFNPASSTPAATTDRVVAYFGSCGLFCFDHHGDLQWEIPMPVAKSYAGNATSPVIVGDRVILYRGNHVDHFLLAVHLRTGKPIWRVPQAEPFASELACTACPVVYQDKLLVHSARSVQAFALDSGQQLWQTKCATTATSTPVLAGDQLIVAAWNKMGEPALRPSFPSFEELLAEHDQDGNRSIEQDELPRLMIFHRPDGAEAPQNGASIRFGSVDRNRDGQIDDQEWKKKLQELKAFRAGYQQHGMLAIPLDSQGTVPPNEIRVLARQAIPEVPSPLFHQGLVYFVKNGGVLTCLDLESGRRTARVRTGGKGTHYASPVICGNKLLCTAGNGKISVLRLGERPRVLAVNDMGEDTFATPAIADGVIYVRTHQRLCAFASGGEPAPTSGKLRP